MGSSFLPSFPSSSHSLSQLTNLFFFQPGNQTTTRNTTPALPPHSCPGTNVALANFRAPAREHAILSGVLFARLSSTADWIGLCAAQQPVLRPHIDNPPNDDNPITARICTAGGCFPPRISRSIKEELGDQSSSKITTNCDKHIGGPALPASLVHVAFKRLRSSSQIPIAHTVPYSL